MTDSIFDCNNDAVTPPPECVLVAGATGGIGQALCAALSERFPEAHLVRMARDPKRLQALHSHTVDIQLDIGDEKQITEAVARVPTARPIDWVFVATGWLHDSAFEPEKTYRRLEAEHLIYAYRINAVGPAILLSKLAGRIKPLSTCRVGVLSARVGSISDNRLGGWYAYRASKAALNMLIKNYAIEFARKNPARIIVGLQPGTTDTALSAPFQRNVPQGHLQTPEYTATQLIRVMEALKPEHSGRLFDFLGEAFEP